MVVKRLLGLVLVCVLSIGSLPSVAVAQLLDQAEDSIDKEAFWWVDEGDTDDTWSGVESTFKSPEDAKAAAAMMAQAKELQVKGKTGNAFGIYKKVFKKYEHSALAPEALYQMGRIKMQNHQFGDAFGYYQQIIKDYPAYPRFNQVIEEEFRLARDMQGGARPYYWGIIPGFRDYTGAIDFFESIVLNAPRTEYAPMALMNIAVLAKEHKKAEDSIDALDRLVSEYPRSDLALEAYIMIGDTYMGMVDGPQYDQKATIDAVHYYEEFLVIYPQSERVKEVECKLRKAKDLLANNKLAVGDFYYRYRDNSRAATVYYSEAINVDPNSKPADVARGQIDKIKAGIKAEPTIVDRIFGRYQAPSSPAYLDEARLAELHTESFELKSNNPFGEGTPLPSTEVMGNPDKANMDTQFIEPSGEKLQEKAEPAKPEEKPV